jgi:hypothetical protein
MVLVATNSERQRCLRCIVGRHARCVPSFLLCSVHPRVPCQSKLACWQSSDSTPPPQRTCCPRWGKARGISTGLLRTTAALAGCCSRRAPAPLGLALPPEYRGGGPDAEAAGVGTSARVFSG